MKGRAWVWPLVLVGLVVATVAVTPRPLDRRVRLERDGSAPFDAEVFHAMLPALAGPVENVAVTPYERLADTTLVGTTYVILARSYTPDAAEAARLLRYAARGNTVLVATNVFNGPLAHALGTPDTTADGRRGLRSDWAEEIPFLTRGDLSTSDTLRHVAPGVAGAYGFPVAVRTATLSGVDSTRAAVRALAPETYGPGAPVLVTTAWGRGRIVVSSTPLAFTNAALTGPGDAARYLGAVFADVPRGRVLWDDSVKPYRSYAETPLRFVLTTPALRWAYFTLVVAGLLWVLFRGRRWQRPIPERPPPPNAQREFARTVGRLHLVSGDTQALARRKARTLLDRIERDLRVSDPDLSDTTAARVAVRTDLPEARVRSAFARLRALAEAPARRPDADALVALDHDLDALFARESAPPLYAVPSLVGETTERSAQPGRASATPRPTAQP